MTDKRAVHNDLFQQLEGPHTRGDAAEAIMRAAFAVRGVTVLRPENDNEPYDFVLESGSEFYRIQAKTAYDGENEGAVRFETRSTQVTSAGYRRSDYEDEIEYFAVYSPLTEDIYLVSISEPTKNSMTIRYEPPANGNWATINWHEDYRLDVVLPRL